MAEKNILHMLTPTKHTSPFDVNMALDAGYDAVLTYNNVTLDEVTGLVQDAIFSRPPKVGARTGMFFGGKNASLALDMLAKAKKALVPPFSISFFADPAGSFTTAAAMVACVEKVLKRKKASRPQRAEGRGVRRHRRRRLCGRRNRRAGRRRCHAGRLRRNSSASATAPSEIKTRFNVDVQAADGSDDGKKSAILAETEVALCAGRAGVQVLSSAQLAAAKRSADRRRRQCGPARRHRRLGNASKRRRDHASAARSAWVRWPSATSNTKPNSVCFRK